MTEKSFKISAAAVAFLVVLRVAIGWHFFYEGLWKTKHPEFSAEPYFRAATGPLADEFRGMVPDIDGRNRLDSAWLAQQGGVYLESAKRHYGLSEEQSQKAARALELRSRQAAEYLDVEEKQEIKLYLAELDRLDAAEGDPMSQVVPFQQKRVHSKRTELAGTVKPWLTEIDKLVAAYQSDIDHLLTDEQRARGPIAKPKTMLGWIDTLTIWTTLGVGVCLMLGLFTRLASVVGAGFLLMVVLAMPALPYVYPQPPPSVGHALLINKEVLEMLTLLFLASTHVGRWGGLDFFIHHLLKKMFPGKQTAKVAS